jgi:hypothetical protein
MLVHTVATMTSYHIIATVTSYHIIATMTLYTIVAFDTTVVFVVPLVALLASMPVLWREEHFLEFQCIPKSIPFQFFTITTYCRKSNLIFYSYLLVSISTGNSKISFPTKN